MGQMYLIFFEPLTLALEQVGQITNLMLNVPQRNLLFAGVKYYDVDGECQPNKAQYQCKYRHF